MFVDSDEAINSFIHFTKSYFLSTIYIDERRTKFNTTNVKIKFYFIKNCDKIW